MKKASAITAVLSFQSPGVCGPKIDTPEANGFAADGDASFGKQIFDVAVTQIESVVQPDSIGNDICWESVAFVCVHLLILPISAL